MLIIIINIAVIFKNNPGKTFNGSRTASTAEEMLLQRNRRWSYKLPKSKENGLYFFIAHVGNTTKDMPNSKSNIFLGHIRTTYILELKNMIEHNSNTFL